MLRYRIRDVMCLTIVTALLAGWYVNYRRPRPSVAEKVLGGAVARAKRDDKLVLLVFGLHDKKWSDRLDQFHADPDVNSVLNKYFVLARIDIEQPGGMEMYSQRGERGAPAFSILDASGAHLSDSGQAEENFGFPNNPDQVDRYIAALKAACPELTDNDVAVLRQKLEQMRVAPPN